MSQIIYEPFRHITNGARFVTYIKKCGTKHELERRPHRQTVDDTAGVPIVFRKTSGIKIEQN